MIPIFPSLDPMRGKLFIAAYAEPVDVAGIVDLQTSTEGLEHRSNAAYDKEHPNYRGWIVAIGDGVTGLQWGDEVALRQRGGLWFQNGFRWFAREYSNSGYYRGAPGQQLFMENDHYLIHCTPDLITYRHGHYHCYFEEPQPVFKRLYVKYEGREALNRDADTGLIVKGYGLSEISAKIACDYNPPPLARVISTGFDVKPEDYQPGDWVLCEQGHGTLIIRDDGEYGMIDSEFCPVNFGPEKPQGAVEWVYAGKKCA